MRDDATQLDRRANRQCAIGEQDPSPRWTWSAPRVMCHHQMVSDEVEGWTDEDDALLAYETLPAWHPSLFVDVFRAGLEEPEFDARIAAAFVTPESRNYWGDFSRARALFSTGLKISMTALYAVGAPDVAYVRLVETDEHTNDDISKVAATAHATLVWRPEIAVVPGSSWRIHQLGDQVDPDLVPRTARGFDPRTLR